MKRTPHLRDVTRKDWIEMIGFWLLMTFGILVLVGAIGLWKHFECKNRGGITERENRYSVLSGCYLQADSGRWLPADAYRDLVQ